MWRGKKMTIIMTPSITSCTRGGITIEFSEMRGPNKIFGPFCKKNKWAKYFAWTPHLRTFYRNATSNTRIQHNNRTGNISKYLVLIIFAGLITQI